MQEKKKEMQEKLGKMKKQSGNIGNQIKIMKNKEDAKK